MSSFFKRCNIEQKHRFRVYFVSFFLSCILYGLMFTHKDKMNESPKRGFFCLTASEIFLDLPVCTKNHDYDIGIVVMNRSKKCTSHQLLTEKLLDLTS